MSIRLHNPSIQPFNHYSIYTHSSIQMHNPFIQPVILTHPPNCHILFQIIAQCLNEPEVGQSEHLPLLKQLLKCVSSVIHSITPSSSSSYSSLSLHLFTVVLRILASRQSDVIRNEVVSEMIKLSEIQGGIDSTLFQSCKRYCWESKGRSHVHVHIHVYMYIYMYTCTYTFIHVHIHCTCIQWHIRTCIHVDMYICTYTC